MGDETNGGTLSHSIESQRYPATAVAAFTGGASSKKNSPAGSEKLLRLDSIHQGKYQEGSGEATAAVYPEGHAGGGPVTGNTFLRAETRAASLGQHKRSGLSYHTLLFRCRPRRIDGERVEGGGWLTDAPR